ncbi:MAG: hypothetical protein ICV73_15040, partial [Acetobacteraceae bacterium]|nr:hypothetical protein [Acetobacteraceae bacterium]
MARVVAANPVGPTEPLWEAPDLAIERARTWDRVSVAVFRRGGGEGAWRNPWHRIVLSPTLLGPIAQSFDGGPTRRFTLRPGTLGFYPAGVQVDVSHGPGRVLQVLQDP